MTEHLRRPQFGRLVIGLFIAFGALLHATPFSFTPTGSMLVARASHQATVLLDGRVLVTGGYDNSGSAVARAEIFSAVTGTWSMTTSNIAARMDHAATRLRDGRVLVVGGASSRSSCSPHSTAEIYDPATGGWSVTGDLPMSVGSGGIAVVLGDGRVLVSGGGSRCGGPSSAAALFNPSTGTWSTTASMTTPRAFHDAVLLVDGRALVTGGTTAENGVLRAGEVYDPKTATWTVVENSGLHVGVPPVTRATCAECSSFTLLSDGKFLVTGGYSLSGIVQSSAELFDPAAGTRNLIGPLQTARAGHTGTRLANGAVLIAGGGDGAGQTSTAEVYVPEIAYETHRIGVARGSDAPGLLSRPWAVATNSRGHVFVSHSPGRQRTRLFDYGRTRTQAQPLEERWHFLKEIGEGLGGFWDAVRVDRDDNVWAVDETTNTVMKFNPEGHLLMSFGRRPKAADDVEESPASGTPLREQRYVNHPTDVTWDPTGNIFVADAGNARVAKYDSRGRFIKAIGGPGSGPSEMKAPHSLAADARGNIYVADGGNARIQVFDNDLTLQAIYDAVGTPWTVCITPGPRQYLYSSSNPDKTDATSGFSSGEVYKMDLDGTIVGKFGRGDNALGSFGTLHEMDCRDENEIVAVQIGDGVLVIKLRP